MAAAENKPNADALAVMWDYITAWVEAGRPQMTCLTCYAPLVTAEERERKHCGKHWVQPAKPQVKKASKNTKKTKGVNDANGSIVGL